MAVLALLTARAEWA